MLSSTNYYNMMDLKKSGTPAREEGDPDKNSNRRMSVGEILEKYDDIDEGWKSRQVKNELQQVYYEWLSSAAQWKSFITLTFKDERTHDVAFSYYKRLIQVLNKRLFGNHYVRKVGHCYFNYVVGMEFTLSREVCHFHVLVDQPVNYELIHSWWGCAAGMAWISKVESQEKALYYVTKYVCKGGDENIQVYLKSRHKTPVDPPLWWFASR